MKSVFLCLAALLLLAAVLVECRKGGRKEGPRGGGGGQRHSISSEEESPDSASVERGRTSHSRKGGRGDNHDNKACKMTDSNDVVIGEERPCTASDEEGVAPQCDSEAVNVQVTNGNGSSVDRKITFCTGFNKTAFLDRVRERECTEDTDCNQRDAERTCSLTVTLDTETLTFCRNPADLVELNQLWDLKNLFRSRGGRRGGKRGHDSSEENETTTTNAAEVVP